MAGGLLQSTGRIKELTSHLTPITMLQNVPKAQWELADSIGQDSLKDNPLAWHERVPTSLTNLQVSRWRWVKDPADPPSSRTLLNEHSSQMYWSRVRRDRPLDRGLPAPSWELTPRAQTLFLKMLWEPYGVLPQTAAVAWQLAQKALPNANRWTGFLQIFDHDVCQIFPGAARNSSSHIFYECQQAQEVWTRINVWHGQQEGTTLPDIDKNAALFACNNWTHALVALGSMGGG